MPLRIEEKALPNGDPYGEFYVGKQLIGRAYKLEDGWRVFQKRKTMPTPEMAAKVMLDDKLNALKKEEELTRKLLDALRLYCGGQLPSTTKPQA